MKQLKLYLIALSLLSSCMTIPSIEMEANESLRKATLSSNADCVSKLRTRDYSGLAEELRLLIEDYERDYRKEDKLWLYLDCLVQTNEDLLGNLNSWVDEQPKSPYAHLARGIYFQNVAYKKRGGRWINETSKEQISGLTHYTSLGIQDLEMVLTLRPSTQAAYWYLIDLAKSASENRDRIEKYYRSGVALNPYSYVIRRQYILFLTPRWGGSYEKMDKQIEIARQYQKYNMNLKRLSGAVSEEIANMYRFSGNYKYSLKYYDEALLRGDEPNAYLGRAISRYNLGMYQEAAEDIDRAIFLRPTKYEYHEWKAKIYRNLRAHT